MSFDALTLAAVRDELEPLLTDGRIQRLAFVDELVLALETFSPRTGRTNVLLSAHLEQGRIHQIDQLPARSLERDTPFSLVARKHLRNARIRSVHQPRLERVFELDCEQRDASGQHYKVLLIVEAMGRRSNLILVDQKGVIVDAARRSPPSRNPRRPVLPHLPYEPPPAQERLYPEQLSAEALSAGARAQASLAKHLSERIAGLSPLGGRELAFRATGAVDTANSNVDWAVAARTAADFLSVVESHSWAPMVAFDEDAPLEFAPYALTHLAASGARLESFDTVSAAIETYYARRAVAGPARRGDTLAAERRALLVPLERAIDSTGRRIAALEHQLDSGHDQRDPLRRAGELILTHQADLAFGSDALIVNSERIELDPRLSAVDNAQEYFARYRKAREAEQRVPALLDEARQHASHLADLRTLVELADGMDAVRALRREVGAATGGGHSPTKPEATKIEKRRKPVSRAAPYRRLPLGDGFEALVGVSAAGNATVTFDVAASDDLWLHARGLPGAHVILRTNGRVPPDAVIERAAELAAEHSAARGSLAVEVDVAARRFVRKIPRGAPGLVRYTNERTVRVTPRA